MKSKKYRLLITISILFIANIIIFYIFSTNSSKSEFNDLLQNAMDESLSEELAPYGTLTEEKKETRWRELNSTLSFGNIELTKKLLANIELDPLSDKDYILLQSAVRADNNSGVMTELIIQAGLSDVNKFGEGGSSLLHWAAYSGNYEAAEVLIKHGANVNSVDIDSKYGKSFSKTPLHTSAQYGTWRVAELLLDNGADYNVKDSSGSTPLDIALSSADPDHESPSGKRKVADLIRQHMGTKQ